MRLEDRASIVDLVALHHERIDEYDIDSLRHAVHPGLRHRLRTRPRRARYRRPGRAEPHRGWSGSISSHPPSLGQTRVVFDSADPDRATALTYVTASHEEWEGRQWRAQPRYIDVVALGPAAWQLAERRVRATMIENRPEID